MKPALHVAVILSCAMASPAFAATVYTGDTIDGKKVISQLDVSDLAPGQIHKFFFEGVEMGTGQHWYVPVMVAKGVAPGKRLLLVSGVHGDELNPIGTVLKVFAELDPSKLSGAVIGVVGSSRPGVEHTTRGWLWMDLGHSLINPNRTWPGDENGNTVQRHSWLLMNRLIKGNADIGVDIHTGGNGIDFGLFSFTSNKDKEALHLSKLFPLDQIYLFQGTGGSLSSALIAAGIPGIHPGAGRAPQFRSGHDRCRRPGRRQCDVVLQNARSPDRSDSHGPECLHRQPAGRHVCR